MCRPSGAAIPGAPPDLTGEPTMTKNLLLIENDAAYITPIIDDNYRGAEIVTCRLWPDRYIRIDDGKQYPQLCKGASRRGPTLS